MDGDPLRLAASSLPPDGVFFTAKAPLARLAAAQRQRLVEGDDQRGPVHRRRAHRRRRGVRRRHRDRYRAGFATSIIPIRGVKSGHRITVAGTAQSTPSVSRYVVGALPIDPGSGTWVSPFPSWIVRAGNMNICI